MTPQSIEHGEHSNSNTPRKRKLKRKVQALRTKLWRTNKMKKPYEKEELNTLISQLKCHLPLETVNFIERQIKLHKSKTSRQRYAITDKMLALSIFYQSRKAYKILSKLFALPSKSTLQRTMQHTNIMPGFVEPVLDVLKVKVSTMDQRDRYVALISDEMSLKMSLTYNHGLDKIEGFEDFGENNNSLYVSDHALVFMVHGLLSKWKQPIAYFLTAGTVTSEKLQELTRMCINRVEQIGLNVKVLICDQGSNNRCFLQKLERVTIERPYISVNEKKIFVIYDPPHLLKNIHNNFLKGGYKYDDVDIRWPYIVDFYNRDKEMGIRMAPKLTDKHINLPPFTAMRVNLAA